MDAVPLETHRTENRPPEFSPRDLWREDAALREALVREGAGAFADDVARYGAIAGSELAALGFDANRDTPRLCTHDRFGHRIDRVEFHPAYHALMSSTAWLACAGRRLRREPTLRARR